MENLKIELTQTPKKKPGPGDKLGFGTVFTDHMMLMEWDRGIGWHDARIVPLKRRLSHIHAYLGERRRIGIIVERILHWSWFVFIPIVFVTGILMPLLLIITVDFFEKKTDTRFLSLILGRS